MLRLFVTERFSPSTDELYEDAKDPLFLGEATAHRETGSTDDSIIEGNDLLKKGDGKQKRTHAKSFECSVCLEAFAHHDELTVHVRSSHTGEPQFNCDVCKKSFSVKSRQSYRVKACLTGQILSVCPACKTNISLKPFECGLCAKRFPFEYNLVEHTRTHTGEKPFSCGVCEKRFTLEYSFTQHLETHKGRKLSLLKQSDNVGAPSGDDHLENAERQCGDNRSHPGDGKEHVDADHGQGLWRWTSEDETRKLSQIGAKLLKCKVCFKTFNDEIQLNMHMRYHPREQTFSCYVCEKDFKSIFDLSSHIKCHTGKKHFKCGDCGMTFTFKANLTKHMNKHKKLFQCEECHISYTTNKSLLRHLNTHN